MLETEQDVCELRSNLARLLDEDIIDTAPIGGGGNSRVYRLGCRGGRAYVAKLYFRRGADERDRLDAEFVSHRFLWEHGIRCIPEPVALDREGQCAVYRYVGGERIRAEDVTGADVDAAAEFLLELKGLRGAEGSRDLPEASEACFSVQAIVESIERRLERLTAVANGGAPLLRRFLEGGFVPALGAITQWCRSMLKAAGMSFEAERGEGERTLSPSDFGFHNAIRGGDGRLVFLDFEHFGWDDPAKMICDFLLHPHPAMALGDDPKRRFVVRVLGGFQDQPDLAARVKVVYPLFGLKWCLILLNEFVPDFLLRRGFARGGEVAQAAVQAEQLAKARTMLQRVRREYECFPYWD